MLLSKVSSGLRAEMEDVGALVEVDRPQTIFEARQVAANDGAVPCDPLAVKARLRIVVEHERDDVRAAAHEFLT
jgi:hypothetical protein